MVVRNQAMLLYPGETCTYLYWVDLCCVFLCVCTGEENGVCREQVLVHSNYTLLYFYLLNTSATVYLGLIKSLDSVTKLKQQMEIKKFLPMYSHLCVSQSVSVRQSISQVLGSLVLLNHSIFFPNLS